MANKDLKKLRAGALKRLQAKLGEIKIEPRDETVTGEVAFMPNISSALVKTDEGIYMIGPRQRPQADPDLGDEPYLRYFVEALVALKQLTVDEGEVALAEIQRQRASRDRSISWEILKNAAKERGYDLVKRRG